MERHFSPATLLFLTAGVHRDKVPRWSKAAFQDKFNIMKGKLERPAAMEEEGGGGGGGGGGGEATKYSDLDRKLSKLQKKLREGSALETGQRGANKVSALAEELFHEKQEATSRRKSSTAASASAAARPAPAPAPPPAPTAKKGVSESCHFCGKRVYVVERMSAEGRFFHRSCFRCDYCGILLRLGGYVHHREGPFEGEGEVRS